MKARYDPSVVCRMCSYDANLATASHCEICNQPLKRDRISPGRFFTIGSVLGRCCKVVDMLTETQKNSRSNGIKSSHDYTNITLSLLSGSKSCKKW